MSLARRSWPARIFGVPAALGALTAVGLLLALIQDGIWDFVAAIALATPVAVMAWKIGRARRDEPPRRDCVSD